MPGNFYRLYGKRIFDLIASFLGLILLSPLFLTLALLIKLYDRGPIFFKHRRVGRHFQPFYVLKFRTMVVDAEKTGPPITRKDDPRITPLGRFLRWSKLDELPQLLNVLRGEMSLVGPRPEVEKYVRQFEKDYREILEIRPGITDYAAIEFRNEEELLKDKKDPEKYYLQEILPRKIKLYKKYLKEISFSTDLKIIGLTLWRLLDAN